MIMRIDKLLCEMNIGSRRQVKELIRNGLVQVNGISVTKADMQINGEADLVCCGGKEYRYRPYVYYMMNKPAGVITAAKDTRERTVWDLFCERLSEENAGSLAGIPVRDIFPVGRLDKDTVGLLLFTNDGEMAHRLLAPGRHVPKKYYVKTDRILDETGQKLLREGVDIGEKTLTRPAQLICAGEADSPEYYLTITEGKFHQVKRMFQAAGRQVVYLKRVSMGTLMLDEALGEGQIRELTKEEVSALC